LDLPLPLAVALTHAPIDPDRVQLYVLRGDSQYPGGSFVLAFDTEGSSDELRALSTLLALTLRSGGVLPGHHWWHPRGLTVEGPLPRRANPSTPGPKPLGRRLEALLANWEPILANSRNERVVAIDRRGILRIDRTGTPTKVVLRRADLAALRGGGLVVTHNHPLGGGFSREDLKIFQEQPLRELRVVAFDRDGRLQVYRLQRRAGFDAARFAKSLRRQDRAWRSRALLRLLAGRVDREELACQFVDAGLRALAKQPGAPVAYDVHHVRGVTGPLVPCHVRVLLATQYHKK
jgi:hypothetical protein